MKNYELLIENQLIELDDKFNFSFLFNSFIFQDILKVKSNRTTTIKIPKTNENLKAINFANIPENKTVFPYRIKEVELWRNGLPIIQKGNGFVLAISDYIEIAIIWGTFIDIKKIYDLKIRELPGSDYVVWDNSQVITDNSNYGFALADFGLLMNQISYLILHPFVKLSWLIEKITENSGININIPEWITDYKKIAIPLLDKNPTPKINGEVPYKFDFVNSFDLHPTYFNDPLNYVTLNYDGFIANKDFSFSLPGEIYLTFTNLSGTPQWSRFRIFQNEKEVYNKQLETPDKLTVDSDLKIDCKSGDKIKFVLNTKTTNFAIPFGYVYNPSVTSTGNFSLHIIPISIEYGDKYPIINNLPDISGFDLINTISAMFGLFAYYSENGIGFYSIDEIYEKRSIAKDWTKKVITGSKIDSLIFSFSDFAKRNWLKYKKDESVLINANDYLEVDSEILDEEKTLYEMKFAASDSSVYENEINPIIFIPLYKMDENNNPVYAKEKIEPRIAVLDSGNQLLQKTAYFPLTLYFSELIRNYYSKYQEIIFHPKVIEVRLLLTDLDIYELDFLIPIYLEQTGNYYIILDLQIDTNNIAKAKLIQM